MFNCVHTLYINFSNSETVLFGNFWVNRLLIFYNVKIMARNSVLLEEASDFHEGRRLLFLMIP